MEQETLEYGLLQHIKFCLECGNESQAIRLIEKYGFEKQEGMYNKKDMEESFYQGWVLSGACVSFKDAISKFFDSEFLQKLRATKSDAEARRLINNQ